MKKLEMAYQLVPPYSHRRNATERAIQTWKGHCISSLNITDKKFSSFSIPTTPAMRFNIKYAESIKNKAQIISLHPT